MDHLFVQNNAGDNASVIEELKELGKAIKDLRSHITKLQNESSEGVQMSEAKDQLDTIVEAAAHATNTILDKVEQIEGLQSHFPEDEWAKVNDYIVRIYEACSFQDISGQRIHKVLRIIKNIENGLEDVFKNYTFLMNMHKSAVEDKQKTDKLNMQIVRELYNMSVQIANTRQEIANVHSAKLQQYQFNTAKDELEAVSRAAAQATHTILSCAEAIEAIGAKNLKAEVKERLMSAIIRIYEECSFHDLTGQRLSKVVNALVLIDAALSKVFSGIASTDVLDELVDEASVLVLENGPQLPRKAPTQEIIDAIFNNKS